MRDKRSAIETLAIRSSCRKTETPVLWVHRDAQLADGLTKGRASFRLEDFSEHTVKCGVSFMTRWFLAPGAGRCWAWASWPLGRVISDALAIPLSSGSVLFCSS